MDSCPSASPTRKDASERISGSSIVRVRLVDVGRERRGWGKGDVDNNEISVVLQRERERGVGPTLLGLLPRIKTHTNTPQ